VRAWFDTVLHPALQGLENERRLLEQQNWTFRFRSGTLEQLGLVAELIPPGAVDNLWQFASFFPEVEKAIERHDDCFERLALDCRVLQKAILNDTHFRQVFAAVAAEVPQQLGQELQSYFGAFSSEEDFMAIIAEDLVNNIQELPGLYTTAELWNHYRARFEEAVATPELTDLREETVRSGQDFLEAVTKLKLLLEKVSAELSLQFDVPIVAAVSSDR
jgi:hypothetical protein